MSAPMDATDWQAEVLRLKAEGMESKEIATLVGKHAATVRKVIARAAESTNGNGPREIEADMAASEHRKAVEGGYIPGQTTVDDFAVPAEDDPEHDLDPLDQFRSEAGDPVGPMVPAPLPEPGESESRLRGTRQMALDFGPEADVPVGGTIVIRSDKLASGFYGLGDVITGTFTARIVDVAGKERLQRASEEFRAQPQAHVALITELSLG